MEKWLKEIDKSLGLMIIIMSIFFATQCINSCNMQGSIAKIARAAEKQAEKQICK